MGIYVYIQLIHFVIQQQLTQQCKAIILHEDIKEKKNNQCLRISTPDGINSRLNTTEEKINEFEGTAIETIPNETEKGKKRDKKIKTEHQ